MTTHDILIGLGRQIDSNQQELTRLDEYYRARQPAAFLSPAAKEALGNRLQLLTVNLPRLAVTSLAERLRITGFRLAGAGIADQDLWRIWRRNVLGEQSNQAMLDALVLGRSHVVVWSGTDRATPLVTAESARQVATLRDPATRAVSAACKRWVADGHGRAVVYEPDRITRFRSEGRVVAGAGIPSQGWRVLDVLDNPLGQVPVVELLNRGRLLELDGVSEMADLLPLADALTKLMSDLMVTSEYFSQPRRWATGLELIEDPNNEGQFINPFNSDALRVWMGENSETRFGQFPQADLSSYRDAVATLTKQIASLAALPPHFVGVLADANPTSADALRASEANLVARAAERQRSFGVGWADVARLIIAVRDGVDTSDLDVEPIWHSPETRSPSQEADATVKLVQAGILPVSIALERLGYTSTEIERITALRIDDALNAQGVNLDAVLS